MKFKDDSEHYIDIIPAQVYKSKIYFFYFRNKVAILAELKKLSNRFLLSSVFSLFLEISY